MANTGIAKYLITAKTRSTTSCMKWFNVLSQGNFLTGSGELSHKLLALSKIWPMLSFLGSPGWLAAMFRLHEILVAFWRNRFGLQLHKQLRVRWHNWRFCVKESILLRETTTATNVRACGSRIKVRQQQKAILFKLGTPNLYCLLLDSAIEHIQ